MNNPAVLKNIKELLPALNIYSVCEIKPDGSSRFIYRIKAREGSFIAVYNPRPGIGNDTDENNTFIYIQGLLLANDINVPGIIGFSCDKSIIILEDLGDIRLQEHFLEKGYNRGLIEAIMRTIYKIGRITSIDKNQIFNPDYTSSFIFEHECMYFYNQFVKRFYYNNAMLKRLRGELLMLAGISDTFIRYGLIHRDMQSRNIMIKDGRFYFIDFQGARMGHRAYDFASFIFDAYSDIYPSKFKMATEILTILLNEHKEEQEAFMTEFRYISVFRLMQMLGAFCNLYFNRRRNFFSKYIFPTYKMLWDFLEIYDIRGTACLLSVLEEIGKEYPTSESILLSKNKTKKEIE